MWPKTGGKDSFPRTETEKKTDQKNKGQYEQRMNFGEMLIL